MGYGQFLRLWSGLTIVIVALFALVNYYADPLAIFRLTERPIKIYGNARYCKYALSLRYLGDHFDSLVLGASGSGKYPVEQAESKVYNGSLPGANLAELLPLLDRATSSGKVHQVFLCLDPYMMKDATPKTSLKMENLEREALFGSVGLMRVYFTNGVLALTANRWPKEWCNELGVVQFATPPIKWWENKNLREEDDGFAQTGYPVHPDALAALKTMVDLCKARGVTLNVSMVALPEKRFELLKQARENFERGLRDELGLEIYDPNSDSDPELIGVLADLASFRDGKHPIPEAARVIWKRVYDRRRH